MKIAVSIWEGRVSPVMDTARHLLLIEQDGNKLTNREIVDLPPLHFSQKARMIAELGIDTLICGAISRPLEHAVTAYGVEIIPWVRGEIEEVLSAYENGNLYNEQYFLPGCHRKGRGHRRRAYRRSGRRGDGRGRMFKEEL